MSNINKDLIFYGCGPSYFLDSDNVIKVTPYLTDFAAKSISRSGMSIAGKRFSNELRYVDLSDDVKDNVEESLKNAEANGIKMAIQLVMPDSRINDYEDPTVKKLWDNWISQFKELAKDFKGSDGLACWLLADEPSYAIFGQLARCKESILSVDPNHPVTANLYPCVASLSQLRGSTLKMNADGKPYYDDHIDIINSYTDYLEEFKRIFGGPLWSFDMYPIKCIDPNDEAKGRYFDERFYVNLAEVVRATDAPDKISYILYMMTMPHKIISKLPNGDMNVVAYFPEPTYGELSLQLFSALAMRAQGIAAWAFFQRLDEISDTAIQQFLSAPISLPSVAEKDVKNINAGNVQDITDAPQGETTVIYSSLRELMSRVKFLKVIFLNCELVDFKFIGDEYVNPSGNASIDVVPEIIKGNQMRAGFCEVIRFSYGGSFLVTKIKKSGYEYAIFINRSITMTSRLLLFFKYEVRLVRQLLSQPAFVQDPDIPSIYGNTRANLNSGNFNLIGKTFNLEIPPGCMVIFNITQE